MLIKRIHKFIAVVSLVGIIAGMLGFSVSAEGPYNDFNYNSYNESAPTSAGYLPEGLITGESLGIDKFVNPTDIYYDNKSLLYILDAGKNRIVVLNASDLTLNRIIEPYNEVGQKQEFVEGMGLCVAADGTIYVAQRGNNGYVWILNSNGIVIGGISKPDSDLLEEDFAFKPVKVAVDSNGITYVISEGCYKGALQFDADHNFMGFFGSEQVTMNATKLRNEFLKSIFPKSMTSNLERSLPINVNNLDIDSENMVYTTRNDTENNSTQVRKLNYKGKNLLSYQSGTRCYGDIETYYDNKNGLIQSMISDVDVDPDGFFTILDTRRNRLFQFDKSSNMLFVFGGTTSQLGCFGEASAIETIGEKILVLDKRYCSITVFSTTSFGKLVRKASTMLALGDYTNCYDTCNEILKYDSNNIIANTGVGKYYQYKGDYKESLKYFKAANDKISYSNSFYEYRSIILKSAFVYIAIGLIALIVILIIVSKIRDKKRVSDYYLKVSKIKYPFYVMRHPFKGHYMMREEQTGSFMIANIIVALFFVVNIIVRQNTSFLFSTYKTSEFNIALVLAGTVGLFIILVLCNWALGTLMDGEGKLKQIWIHCAYALLPYVIFMIPLTIISNVLVTDEAAFYQAAVWIVYAWTGLSLVLGIREVQQFTMGKTILALFGTALGMAIVCVLYAMVYSMLTQLTSFIVTVFSELLMRI